MLYEIRTILFPLIIADVKEFREESVQLFLTIEEKKKGTQSRYLFSYFALWSP